MEIPKGNNLVIVQKWEEIEMGWGTRPDGFSLHVSLDALAATVRRLQESRERFPEEFTVPDGPSYPYEVDDATHHDVMKSGGTKWYGREYSYPPGSTGGWQPARPRA